MSPERIRFTMVTETVDELGPGDIEPFTGPLNLTRTQVDTLGFIVEQVEQTAVFPSVREIVDRFELESTSAGRTRLKTLAASGVIQSVKEKAARSYTLRISPETYREMFDSDNS